MLSLECLIVVQTFVRKRSQAYHSVFYCHATLGKCVYPIVLVDDIVTTRNNATKNCLAKATFVQTLSNQRSWVSQVLPRH